MSPSPELLIEPPAAVLNAARRWLAAARRSLGEDFLAAYVTGSALTQGFDPRRSDVNLLVVTRALDVLDLDRIAQGIPAHRGAIRISPLLLTRAQIEKSLDVFPMEYLDIQERHLLLEGVDVFADMTVPRTYLRLQCEHELRSRFIRLRQAYLLQRRSPRVLSDTLAGAAASFAALFRNLLRLRGEVPPAHAGRVIEKLADTYGVDAAGLLQAWTHRFGRRTSRSEEIRRRYLQFLVGVERLVAALDKLEVR